MLTDQTVNKKFSGKLQYINRSQGLVTTYLSSKNLDLPYTIIYTRGESTNKIYIPPQVFRRLVFPFPGVTPPPLPINRSVNDHSFYWYVQTTNIEIISAFLHAFSSRLGVKPNSFDQHGRPTRSHWSSFPMLSCRS